MLLCVVVVGFDVVVVVLMVGVGVFVVRGGNAGGGACGVDAVGAACVLVCVRGCG